MIQTMRCNFWTTKLQCNSHETYAVLHCAVQRSHLSQLPNQHGSIWAERLSEPIASESVGFWKEITLYCTLHYNNWSCSKNCQESVIYATILKLSEQRKLPDMCDRGGYELYEHITVPAYISRVLDHNWLNWGLFLILLPSPKISVLPSSWVVQKIANFGLRMYSQPAWDMDFLGIKRE